VGQASTPVVAQPLPAAALALCQRRRAQFARKQRSHRRCRIWTDVWPGGWPGGAAKLGCQPAWTRWKARPRALPAPRGRNAQLL